ncbi:MAG: C39 family peptidase [Ardenticatenia bacterium]|nr:C39 family peptidase [Ardenticatenia bacterium]
MKKQVIFGAVAGLLIALAFWSWNFGKANAQSPSPSAPKHPRLIPVTTPPTPTPDNSSQNQSRQQQLERALSERAEMGTPPLPSSSRKRLQDYGSIDESKAREAALARMRLQVEAGRAPLWAQGAQLRDAIVLYDVNGEVSAYLFPVIRHGKPAGYLTVSAFNLPNPVLEFAVEGSHPLQDARRSLAERDVQPVAQQRPLYLGLLFYAYEIESQGQRRKVFDLYTKKIVEVEEEQIDTLDFPQSQQQQDQGQNRESQQRTTPQTSNTFAYISGVPDWNQFWGSYGCYSGCSPTAAINALGYWDNRGYDRLLGDRWQDAVNSMRDDMNTVCDQYGNGSTSVSDISPGIVQYTYERGYTFTSELLCNSSYCSERPTFDRYQQEIDAGRPIIVNLINPDYYNVNHTVTGVGYDGSGFMIVHDNWEITAKDIYLQYGSGYTDLFFNTIVPRDAVVDTTPPEGSYLSPMDKETVGRFVNLQASAFDDLSGVKEVHFTAKWNGQWHLVYNDTTYPYEYRWDLCASQVPNGEIELGLDIYDNAGNVFYLHTVQPNPRITKSADCQPTTATWSANYWVNKFLAGYVNLSRQEPGNFLFRDWGDGSPDPTIPNDEWSARFVRTVYFPGGEYRFHCQRDDGCRAYLDGEELFSAWWDASFDGSDWIGYVSPGYHEVKVEYYENTGQARLEFWWQGPGFFTRARDV